MKANGRRSGERLAFFVCGQSLTVFGTEEQDLTENSKKTRAEAEASFSRTQTQFLARNRIISEQEAISDARAAKTVRLRELRLDKEAAERAAAAASAPKRVVKR